jgi:hypothetical protein
MGWSLASDWLTVVGLMFLTIGTAAQALANLAEYKSLRQTASAAATAAISALVVAISAGGGIGPGMPSWWYRYVPKWLALIPEIVIGLGQLTVVIFAFSRATLTRLRNEGGEEAVELARFLRLAEVWAIIMIGSGLGLVAALIQLAIAYSG